jgi:ketosteroid isomerase-like protein
MSAEENLANTKKAYAAFASGDVEGAAANLADDIEWIVPGNSTISGSYRGKSEVIGFWMNLPEKGFTTTPEHFLADDDRVVVLTSTSGLTFRDGKVVKFQIASDTALQEKIWGTK